MVPHGWITRKMHSASAPNAISTKAQPKLPITHVSAVPMTLPRLSGAARPHMMNPAMTTADPQKTAGSTFLRYRFIAPPVEIGRDASGRSGSVHDGRAESPCQRDIVYNGDSL